MVGFRENHQAALIKEVFTLDETTGVRFHRRGSDDKKLQAAGTKTVAILRRQTPNSADFETPTFFRGLGPTTKAVSTTLASFRFIHKRDFARLHQFEKIQF